MPVSPPTLRITRRATFDRLRRPDGRNARGAIRVSWVAPAAGDELTIPQVGYAIGRHCGNAVARNRLRRRLRGAVHELATGSAAAEGASEGASGPVAAAEISVLAPGSYLISGSLAAHRLDHAQLVLALGRAMTAAAGARAAGVAGSGVSP